MSVTKEAIVKSATGLHARPATGLVEVAINYQSDIVLESGEKSFDPKEIMDVLNADINCGDNIKITASGADEEEAATNIADYINTTEG